MKFLVDAQLPPALCGWLRERGHEAVHVFEIGQRVFKGIGMWGFCLVGREE